MPDHLIITIRECDDGSLIIESDIAASTLANVCEMFSAMLGEAKRLHSEAHYLERSKN